MVLRGIAASPGIAIGSAVIISSAEPEISKCKITDAVAEIERFHMSLESVKCDTNQMADELSKKVGTDEADILYSHVLLLSDPTLKSEVENLISGEYFNAEYAVDTVCEQFACVFSSMDDELMRQRATDMRDIKNRILHHLLGISCIDVSKLPKGSILIADDLTPSMTAGLDASSVYGIVTQLGGVTSHSAILARALEIPALVAVGNVCNEVEQGELICFDGDQTELYVNPDSVVVERFKKLQEEYLLIKTELQAYKGLESITKNGVKIRISANIGNVEDARRTLEYDAEGVGLFRTEFLFMDRDSIPTEEEQCDSYKAVAEVMAGKPVIIRTLDIGGDKDIPYMNITRDDNPFLGYRAIRLCLDRKEDIYRPQLRAILRASAYGDIKIMIPFVSTVDEYRLAKTLIYEEMAKLDADGIDYNKNIEVGIMVETAAAVMIADVLAKEVDFFSIGTNDLTQYIMEVDRGNDKISYLYSSYDPAVLRAIRKIILSAKEKNIHVGMCGEAAADPKMVPLLLYWGLDEFSMSASSILKTRKLIMSYDIDSLKAVVDKAMSFSTEKEVREYLDTLQ